MGEFGVGTEGTTSKAIPSARQAGADDIHRIGAMFGLAVEEVVSLRGGSQLIGDLSDRIGVNLLVHAGRWKVITEALACPIPSFWIGEAGSDVVGFAWGRVAHHSEFAPLLGVLEFSYVERGARERGIAEAMLASVQSWFLAQGCSSMDAHALPGDRETKNILEEAGFKARVLVMSREIGEPTGTG